MQSWMISVALLALSVAAPASATVVTFTDDLLRMNEDGLPLGLTDPNTLGTPVDIGVADIEVLPVDFSVVAPAQGTSYSSAADVPKPLVEPVTWTLSNNSTDTDIVDLQLVLVTYVDTPFTVGGQAGMISYDNPLEVGFDVDPNDGWFIYNVDRGLGFDPIFLLAVDVGTISVGGSTQIVVQHWLANAQAFLGDDDRFNLVLPTIELRGVFDLVPEPSTAALTALGLVGLVWRRRGKHKR